MQVLKFGGSSLANATNISRVLDIVLKAAEKDSLVMVCSAISGCTDALIETGRLIAAGEKEAAAELAGRLQERHFAIIRRLFTGEEGRSVRMEVERLFHEIEKGPEVIESYGELLSTTIIAAKLLNENVPSLWIDSRRIIVKGDLSATYSNVASTLESNPGVKVFVAPGFIASGPGGKVTTLGRGGSDYSAALFAAGCGASSLQIWTDVPGIMTTNPKDVPGAMTIPRVSYKSAWNMAAHGAKVLYPPTVEPADKAGIEINILDSFSPERAGTVIGKRGVPGWVGVTREEGRVCMVAEGEIDVVSTTNRIRSVLERSHIGVDGIASGNDVIIVKVSPGLEKAALCALHREFFELEPMNTINLFIAGKGSVGTALMELIRSRASLIYERSGKILHVAGVADSSDPGFCGRLIESAPEHSVFVDCTNSETIFSYYVPLMEAGVDVVSCNRRSLAVPYSEYAEMKKTALRTGRKFKYETTVGAALPILSSIALSANSSDEILSIEAVVSCTLNYVLSSNLPFRQALAKAQEIGLTEKDPVQDLEGRDALRKLLILAREAGVHLDEADVDVEPVDLDHVGSDQRFVASLVRTGVGYRASIRLQTVDESHPAYWLKGTDNLIVVRSAFHPSPLIIRGAGEGAKVAASSILNDLLS